MKVIIIERICYGTFTDKTTGKRIAYNRALTRTEDGGGVTYELQKRYTSHSSTKTPEAV